MKILITIKKIMLLSFVTVLLNTSAFADNKNATVKIINAEKKVFTLNLQDIRTKDYAIQISDVNGLVLFDDKISASKRFAKRYDLSKLPIGIYEVKIEGDILIRKQFVKILVNKLEAVEEEEVTIYKPAIELDGSKISLNMFSNKGQPVAVSILNAKSEVLFKEGIENKLAVHKYYDVSEFPAGKYIVRVVSQGSYFYKEINLQK